MITRNHEQYVKQTVSEIHKNVTSNRDVIYRLMQDIAYNEDVQSFLADSSGNANFEMIQRLSRMLSGEKELKEGILDIVLSGNQGAWLDINGGNFYVEPLKVGLPAKANAYYAGMRTFGSLFSSQPQLIFATSIYCLRENKVTILAGRIQKFTCSTGKKHHYEQHGAGPGQPVPDFARISQSGSNAIIQWNKETYVMEKERLPDIDGTILSMAPKNELLRELVDIRREELIMLGIGLLVLAVPFTSTTFCAR